MDSYHFHFERMSNLDLHPLSLPVSRLSPAKSSSSIDQYTHHHSTGDSAYSSFSAGSTAPDYPSPFLLDEIQSQSLHYSDLKCTKPKYSPTGLDSNSKSMDHIYRSMETVPQQHRRSSADFSNMGNPLVRMRPLPPPPPSRLNSFITARNLENSRARQSPEGQLAEVSAPPQPSKPEVAGVRTEPVLGCAFPQLKDHLKQDPDKRIDPPQPTDILNRSALQSGQAEHVQQPWSGRVEHQRKRSHSAYGGPVSEHQSPVSSRPIPQNMISGSIQHKGPFYFVTGVFKSSEPLQGVDEGASVETSRQWSCNAQRRRQSCPDGPSGKLFYQEEHKFSIQSEVAEQTSEGVEEQRTISRESARHHSTSNPIFYCGPDDTSAGAIITPALIKEDHTSHPRTEEMTRVSQLDIPSDKISKEATPLLYHLTGANRAARTDKSKSSTDSRKAIKNTECVQDKPTAETDGQTSPSGEDQQSETPKEQPNQFFYPCGTLDDSYKKYYKEKLKDAQSKVLRATSFKRRDLQLSLPHRFQQRAEKALSVVPAGSPSVDIRPNLDSPGPPEADKDYMRELDREMDKIIEKEVEKPPNIAQPQVSRVGCRRRLTADQKKLSRSEPEKLHQLADAPAHAPCRSLGNEAEALLPDGDHGLVSARRKMFETRGRALSASHFSKSTLKHLQHKALVAYMERKTGQKTAEPQRPAHRNSTAEPPSDCSSTHPPASSEPHRPLSAGQILDSLSGSVKHSQVLSGHRRQSSWREECRHAGGSGSMESLLDRPEHPVTSRSRSTSTPPPPLQVRKHLDEFSAVHSMAISSAERAVDEETGARPGRSASVQEERRLPARASRGKSMEELGASVVWRPEARSHSSEQLDQRQRQRSISDAGRRPGALHTHILRAAEHTHNSQPRPEIPLFNTSVTYSSSSADETHTDQHEPAAAALAVSREQHQTEAPESRADASLSHGDTADPAVCEEIHHSSAHVPPLAEPQSAAPAPSAEDEGLPITAAGTEERSLARALSGEQEREDGAREGNGLPLNLQWELLVQDVVSADRSLARTLYPLADRKTALMLMEQLLSEDTLLMEEHYKNKQLHTLQSAGAHRPEMPNPPPSVSECVLTQQKEQLCHTQLDLLDKKRRLMALVEERLSSLQEERASVRSEAELNGARGDSLQALVRERCVPAELERYTQFVGDLERVVSLLLCLSARLARVQNALSTADDRMDPDERQSLDSRYRLLCKQREDAKDLKDNLDRRERMVSSFLSKQLTDAQLQEYRRFIQTKASLLIRQKDLEEKQRLGEEQLEALLSTVPP